MTMSEVAAERTFSLGALSTIQFARLSRSRSSQSSYILLVRMHKLVLLPILSLLLLSPATSGLDCQDGKIRGVNAGGWLLLEPWITPKLFEEVLVREPLRKKIRDFLGVFPIRGGGSPQFPKLLWFDQVIFGMPKSFWGAKTCFTIGGRWYLINLITFR